MPQSAESTSRTSEARYLRYFGIYFIWVVWIVYATYGPRGFADWVNGWHRWDAEFYFRIWNLGYGYDPHTLAYPPGYSWIVGAVTLLLRIPFDLAAMVVNIPSFFIAGVLASEFLSSRFTVSPWVIFLFHLSNPVGLYAFAPYSDCLFEVFFWGALILAVREPAELSRSEWWTAAALMFFAPWVRVTGFALAVWVFLRRWFALAVIPSVILFLLGNWLVTGDWLYFMHVQEQFLMPSGWLWDGLTFHFTELFKPPPAYWGGQVLFWVQTTVFPCFSLCLLLLTAEWLRKQKQLILAVTLITVALYSRNQAYWRSAFRYDLPLWPMVALPWLVWSRPSTWGEPNGSSGFAGFAPLLKAWSIRVFIVTLIATSFFFQWGLARRFHNGIWVF